MKDSNTYLLIFLASILSICTIVVNHYRSRYLEERREKEEILREFKEHIKNNRDAKE